MSAVSKPVTGAFVLSSRKLLNSWQRKFMPVQMQFVDLRIEKPKLKK